MNFKGHKGIITAKHVCDTIKKHKKLLIMLGKAPTIVETELLNYIIPPIESKNIQISTDIPDIAFIRLPDKTIGILEATTKSFYAIDKRIDKESIELCKNNIGYFVFIGTPNEWLDVKNQIVPSFAYSTVRKEYFMHDGWDYQVMGLNLDENKEIPTDFSGVSGGGIWKIKVLVNEEKTEYSVDNFNKDISLVGVSFNQTPEKGRQIIGHGPESIYRNLYKIIK